MANPKDDEAYEYLRKVAGGDYLDADLALRTMAKCILDLHKQVVERVKTLALETSPNPEAIING